MLKKYGIICLCVLAVCAVMGLNARTEYSQIKTAIEHVEQSANVIVDDVTIIDCFAYVFEDYRLGQKTIIEYVGYFEGTFTAGDGHIVYIGKEQGSYNTEQGTTVIIENGEYFAFKTEDTAIRVMNALQPLTWNLDEDSPNEFWGNIIGGVVSAVNAIVTILGVVFALLQTVFVFITDTISTAWATVEMILYILGLPVTL